MANWIRVSSIAPPMLSQASAQEPPDQAAVDRMIAHWQAKIARVLPGRPDLIVLPECCDSYAGWTPPQSREYHVCRGNQVRDALAAIAQSNRCNIAYPSLRRVADGSWRNSIQMIGRDGSVLGLYDKHHPIVNEVTDHNILPGAAMPLIKCDFGTVGCAICFDLNFAPVREAYMKTRPDLLLFSSVYHGGLMSGYWAYSCRRYMVTSVARLPSGVVSPLGEAVATSTNYFDYVNATINLDCVVAHLDYNWEKLDALRARFGNDVEVHDPGLLGSVLITSHGKTSAAQMAKELQIELLDDYFVRAQKFQDEHRAKA